MKLMINCHTDIRFSFDIKYEDEFPLDIDNDLFLFSSYALRLMKNLGNHMVGDALAYLLNDSPLDYMSGKKNMRPGAEILLDRYWDVLTAQGLNRSEVEERVMRLGHQYDNNDPRIKILDDEYLSNVSKFIILNNNASAKIKFIFTTSPLRLNHKGFGLFSSKIKYYAFASTLVLLKLLTEKYENPHIKKQFISIASICAETQYMGRIPIDQVHLAKIFVATIANQKNQ